MRIPNQGPHHQYLSSRDDETGGDSLLDVNVKNEI